MKTLLSTICCLGILGLAMLPTFAESNDRQIQQAFEDAALAAEDYVVQIRTVGGLDRVGDTALAQGPTTGLIVSSDGYIVSSAFNFAQQPTSILVRLPNGSQTPAELVARDKNRMLVLLRVEVEEELPVPIPVPIDEIHVGQWSLALGRTFRADQVGISDGIISGLNRMYGRVLQTDASISVANYGGPLIDLQGRVYGVLVPMAPPGGASDQSEVAGAEFYDSGIGFAVPLKHILDILPRWQQGKDLLPGKLGVGLRDGKPHLEKPELTTIWPNSPAASASWKTGDVILKVDGQDIETQADLRFQIKPLYAGDKVAVTLLRDKEQIETEISLAGELEAFSHAFLGILPDRKQGEEKGLLVRSVWPESPAAKVGVRTGDRLMKIDTSEISNAAGAISAMNKSFPGESVAITLERQGKSIELRAVLDSLPEDLLPALDKEFTRSEAKLSDYKLLPFTQIAKFYVPEVEENEKQRPGLLLWLGDGITDNDLEVLGKWQDICQRDRLALVIAPPKEETGWNSEGMKYLARLSRHAIGKFDADPNRVVIAGAGKAGQLAAALALKMPNRFHGVVSINAPLPRTLEIPENNPNHRIALLQVASQNTSYTPLIRRDIRLLREARYPVTWIEPESAGEAGALDPETLGKIARWIDGLDRF